MKKNLFTLAAVVVATIGLSNIAKAQLTASFSPVTVNVKLTDAIAIEASAGASSVLFEYKLAEDYNADKSQTIAKQFKVTSTKSYDLSVTASGDFTGGTLSKTLALDILRIGAIKNGGSAIPNKAISGPTALVTGAAATLAQDYDVAYKILTSSELVDKGTGTYTTTLTYTVTAQ